MHQRIMHIDMDAFFASIEQQINPALRGKPVIVGGRNDKYKSVVCAASYEAKACGVESGMPSWKAFKLCPNAIFIPAESSKYIYTSKKIFQILKRYTPKVEINSVDEFFLDVSGCEKIKGSPYQIANKIKKEIRETFGITCSVGIAPTRLTSKLAAKKGKPNGLVVLNKKETKRLLEELPVEKLCGIGKNLKSKLNSLGIRTCGELGRFSLEKLEKKFGKIGLWLKQAARGEDRGEVESVQNHIPKSIGHSHTLRTATSDIEIFKSWLMFLSQMVGKRLRKLKLEGKTIHLSICKHYGKRFSKQKTFSQPTDDGKEIFDRGLKILESMNIKRFQARALGISLSKLTRVEPLYLFQYQKKRRSLIQNLDQINNKYGDWTVYHGSLTLLSEMKNRS